MQSPGSEDWGPTEIIQEQLFLGGLDEALDQNTLNQLGITHVLSICREHASEAPTHRTIPIDDAPYENLLIRLPEACEFIQRALDTGGRIYVHCMMGISRSVSVVCAYLMKTRGMSASESLAFVQSRRRVAGPNNGFLEQLDVWAACGFNPSASNSAYTLWRRKHEDENNLLSDSTEMIRVGDGLYLTETLPSNSESLASLLRTYRVTHLVTIPSHQPIAMSESTPIVERCHIPLSDPADTRSEELVLRLPEAIGFIEDALKERPDALVVVHSFSITRICVVVCGYFMKTRGLSSAAAFRLLERDLPLYTPTLDFHALTALWEACGFAPTPYHPALHAFVQKRKNARARSTVSSSSRSRMWGLGGPGGEDLEGPMAGTGWVWMPPETG